MEAILKREVMTSKSICRFFAVLASVAMITLGAYVRIPLPFTPVPITLQTFFVILSAALLGTRLGTAAQLGYIFLGASGLSMFSGAFGGAAYLLGPTGGYILGFVLAGIIIGKTVQGAKENGFLVFGVFCFADFTILACGALWLKILLNLSAFDAMRLGFIPFIPGDLLKAAAAAILYLSFSRRAREIL